MRTGETASAADAKSPAAATKATDAMALFILPDNDHQTIGDNIEDEITLFHSKRSLASVKR